MEQGQAFKLGVAYLLAFVLYVLSGALGGNYYSLLVLLPLCMVPVPGLMCGSSEGVGLAFGHFLEAFLWSGVFAIPAIMNHTGTIDSTSLYYAMAANVVMLGTRTKHEMMAAEGGF